MLLALGWEILLHHARFGCCCVGGWVSGWLVCSIDLQALEVGGFVFGNGVGSVGSGTLFRSHSSCMHASMYVCSYISSFPALEPLSWKLCML